MSREYKCERCGIAPEKKGYDEGIDQESAAAIRIAEVQTNFGIVWAMCLECRREWVKWLNGNKTMQEYSRAGFRLEHWRVHHRKTGNGDIEAGLKLIDTLNELDTKLFAESTEWFKKTSSASKPQKSSFGVIDDEDGNDDDRFR